MFRRITYIVTLLLFMTPLGCKKFLDVKPLDRLSGNTFFQNRNDVESNLWDIYGLFRDAAGSCPLFAAAGEMRGGQMEMSPQKNDGNDRTFLVSIAKNDLSNVVNTPGGKDFWNIFKLWNLSDWRPFYRIIQASNILVYELDHRKIADITDTDIKGYQAEAIFMRCMTYFIMVRLWGDVPYYTDAYHDAPLSREKMVTVMNSCITDLGKVKDNLQWTFNDPANQGAKASRGAALALMMEMSMWNAGFDKGNAQQAVPFFIVDLWPWDLGHHTDDAGLDQWRGLEVVLAEAQAHRGQAPWIELLNLVVDGFDEMQSLISQREAQRKTGVIPIPAALVDRAAEIRLVEQIPG